MARIDISQISTSMVNEAASQEAQTGSAKVWDPAFPLMETPINRKVLVYFPQDFDARKVESLVHDTHRGKRFGQVRCINGLSTGFEAFGYTGECPFCQATEAAWDLYNIKLDQKAKELNINRDNDPDDLLKGTRDNLLKEMAVRPADKYVCFPAVLIPCDDAGNLIAGNKEPVKPVYVLWRKQRFDDKFSSDVLEARTSPAGCFMRWSFTYDTKGKQATAMDSARNLKVKIIENAEQLAQLEQYRAACEQVIAPYTQMKAIDNIKALNFYTFADVQKDAEATIKQTRLLIAAMTSANGGAAGPALGTTQANTPAIGTTAAQAIANFGQTPVGTAQVAQPTANVAAPTANVAAPTATVGQPMAGVDLSGIAGVGVAQPTADVAQPAAPAAPIFG